jgi:hypothetical protein
LATRSRTDDKDGVGDVNGRFSAVMIPVSGSAASSASAEAASLSRSCPANAATTVFASFTSAYTIVHQRLYQSIPRGGVLPVSLRLARPRVVVPGALRRDHRCRFAAYVRAELLQ